MHSFHSVGCICPYNCILVLEGCTCIKICHTERCCWCCCFWCFFARGLDEKKYCTYSITLINKKIVRSLSMIITYLVPPKSIPQGNATTTTRGKKTKRCACSHTDLQPSLHHADAERLLSTVFSVGPILAEQRAQVFVKTLNRGLQVEGQALQRTRRST